MVLKKLVFVNVYIICLHAVEYENVYGPLYGEQWMLMTDTNGYPHYVNATKLSQNNEMRGHRRNVYFYLYTRQNQNESETLSIENGKLLSSRLDEGRDVKVITHGWLSDADDRWIINMKDAFLRQAPLNVVAVDWSDMSKVLVYPWSAYDTRYVGARVADMLDALAGTFAISGSRVHLIGHSLGAHVMGYAGSYTNHTVGRITGLDPARPLFECPDAGDAHRLDRGDARFVDIIHTCGGLLGYHRSHGHADFYPNKGEPMQPGCGGLQYVAEGCSHGRSCEYFIESIESESGFVSRACDSWRGYTSGACDNHTTNMMGAPADTARLGDYYLRTNSQPLYAMGEN